MDPGLSLDSTVVATREQVSCELAGSVAILHLGTGVYHSLDLVGARIWSLLQSPCRVAQLRDTLLAEFAVAADACERDLLALLHQLAAEQLIEVGPPAGAAG